MTKFWGNSLTDIYGKELPTVSELTYLLFLLDSIAKDLTDKVPHTSANRKIVVDLLMQRSGKSERIIHSHVQALLFSLQLPVDQSKNIKQLWRLRDGVVKHTRSLEAKGIASLSNCCL